MESIINYDWKYKILRHIIWWNNSLHIKDIFTKNKPSTYWCNKFFILRILSCIEFKLHFTNLRYSDSLPAIRFRIMLFNIIKFHFTILIGKSACKH